MSGEGAPTPQDLDASGLRIAVVTTRWYAEVTDSLRTRALATLEECGVPAEAVTDVRVPGAFELPVVAQRLAASHDAVVCLGVVVRGGTPHFEYVCDAVTSGLGRVVLDSGTPVGFGVLTVDDEEQARARAGLAGSPEDKGQEAALAAVETALLLRGLTAP